MTTREEIIALRNECDEFAEQTLQCKGEFPPDFHAVSDERLYAIAHEAGAASRDAEIQRLQMALADAEALELGTAEKCDQLHAELVNALAACKAKDAALRHLWNERTPDSYDDAGAALAIQPDDAALKAWLGKPVAWEYADAFGTHYTDDRRDWMDTPGIESVTCLYSPKGLK